MVRGDEARPDGRPRPARAPRRYKALLLKDAAALVRVEGGGGEERGARQSLMNLLMQLRKTCCHPFLFPEAEGGNPDDTTLEELVAASGKLRVLDRLLVKLYHGKHRVVVFSQFAHMVDILDDYCRLRAWPFCRLTGATNRVQRVVNVRAFNEPSSPLFIFLMTTRAGGLGINLQTADTCVLYDSDWNPQADVQAMARVHRLGQTKTVHVYRLCAGGTAEERVLQRSQKKLSARPRRKLPSPGCWRLLGVDPADYPRRGRGVAATPSPRTIRVVELRGYPRRLLPGTSPRS